VTLRRALLAQGRLDEARVELEAAAAEAPDHIAAMRGLEELRRLARPESSASEDALVLQELEGWLAAVRADRARRATTSTSPQESVVE
jgi:hypothetical protein